MLTTQCCSFNQDFSCIAVGHKKGYTILNCDPFGKVHSKSESGGGLRAPDRLLRGPNAWHR